jgi:RNA polymerase sigma-70 factor (ECF subfamily)
MPDASQESALWIRELVSGNEEVVSEFWREYAPSLERLASSRMAPALQRRLGAEDVVQSVCRTFLRRAREGEFQLDKSDDVWRLLCAITLTKVRQHARFHLRKRRGLNREVVLDANGDSQAPGLADLAPAREPTPAEAAAFADQMQHLLAALDDEERQLVQRKLDGQDSPAIAKAMNCSERTVRRLLAKVRDRWERELGDSLRK